MITNKAVALTALLTLAACSLHFVSAVYVGGEAQQRELNIGNLPALNATLPYQADALTTMLTGWAKPEVTEAPVSATAEPQLAGFDKATLGDVTVALLAIYQKQQAVAVLALQQPGEALSFVRLKAGTTVGDIELSSISQRNVTLIRGAQQVQLRLFNPGSASSE
jgi:hypothetical protein